MTKIGKGRNFPWSSFSSALTKLARESHLTVAYTPKDLDQFKVYTAEVYRPGIMLAGYYQYFDRTRIQIIGLTELSYLNELDPEIRRTHLEKLFSFQPPAVILTRGFEPLPEMMEFAQKYGVPLLQSAEMTSPLMSSLIQALSTELAPRITRHGVLVEVYGEGILILGDSGVGKSETAIELVKRGHRLIADDAVELRKVSSSKIMGMAPENIRHFIGAARIGIINVARLFGIGAVKNSVEVEMVIELEAWDRTKNYDRTGLESNTYDILGVKVPSMLIPVMPGRNLAVILETAAINNRQKEMGYNAAQETAQPPWLAERCERVLSLAVNCHFITRNGSTICMQIIADLHTHTLSATHAFNTLDEMAAKAAALGYAALAITDHGPAMPDARTCGILPTRRLCRWYCTALR